MTVKNFETLEVGKTYKNRKGDLVKIVVFDYSDLEYPYGDDDCYSYTPEGYWTTGSNETENDLVELIIDTDQKEEVRHLIVS
jgi:hypothetical protein